MPRRTALFFSLTLVLASPLILFAQGRELHWRSLTSDARLDSTGRLHVRERQTMVFTGDWNGGERQFRVRLGQDFAFERMLRVNPATGSEQEMREGDLSDVDQYAWAANMTLRWRSRLPTDPPFSGTELTYVLEYSFSNILIPQGDEYYLDHDFAFAERDGVIEQFSLTLALDRAWKPPVDFTGQFTKPRLSPGEGFTVTLPLQYVSAGRPTGVVFGAPASARYGLAILLVTGVLVFGVQLLRREQALGRFAPLVSPGTIDEAWLRTNVFQMLPEVVGAAWDDTTGAPEVAAVLARLVAEKKLESSVTPKAGMFGTPVLHLTILVDRNQFKEHERALIDALFTPNSKVTDTEAVRQRYKSKGFDPAAKIKPAINKMLNTSRHEGGTPTKPARRVTAYLFFIAIALAAATGFTRPGDLLRALGACGFLLFLYAVAISQAARWQKRLSALTLHLLRVLIPVAILVGAVVYRLTDMGDRSGAFVLGALVAFALALCSSIFNMAKSRYSAAHTARRKNLATAREYFRDELRRPAPNLRDEWFPYFMAFGLGKHMDHWFRAFGGESASALTIGSRTSSPSSDFSSTSSGTGSSGWTGFGGGGGFAGGGSSGVWAAAAGSMAAGVAAPSSSSSGGGGGSSGGGSSGGGGGGGW